MELDFKFKLKIKTIDGDEMVYGDKLDDSVIFFFNDCKCVVKRYMSTRVTVLIEIF